MINGETSVNIFEFIDKDIQKKKQEKIAKENKEKENLEKAIIRFKQLRNRIRKFAEIIVYLFNNGYAKDFPKLKDNYYGRHFLTNNVSNNFGVLSHGENIDDHIVGIENGDDFLGYYDFLWDYTKEDTIPKGYLDDSYPKSVDKTAIIELNSYKLNKFCDEFEEEEKLLYEWLKEKFNIFLSSQISKKSKEKDYFYICKETECKDCPYQDKCLEQKKGA